MNTSLQLFDLNYTFELVGALLLALAKSIYYFLGRKTSDAFGHPRLFPREIAWPCCGELTAVKTGYI